MFLFAIVPYTIIMPTDAAVDSVPASELTALLHNSTQLDNVLRHHMVKGEIFSWDLKTGQTIQTASGHYIRVYIRDNVSTCKHIHFINTLPTLFRS
jgi:uncharacterized surface protein with fasciclin (FAS1) repeats